MKKMLIRDIKEWIKLIMSELRSNDEVEAIYIFGSYAKGNAKPISDIDICVLTKRNISKRVKEEILSNSSKNIDISLFWDLLPTIRFRVLKEGKLLYKRDEIALQRVKVATLKYEYYDLTEEDVFEVFKRIDIVKKFVGRIKKILREGSL